MIVILDLPNSNVRRLHKWLCQILGEEVRVSNVPDLVHDSKTLIIPGVGSFTHHIKAIEAIGPLRESIVQRTKLTIGICAGAQILCSSSDEGDSLTRGLGIINERVLLLHDSSINIGFRKISDVGSNSIESFKTPALDCRFYFCHSYALPVYEKYTSSIFEHGPSNSSERYSASFVWNNFIGLQYHPEMSGRQGAILFRELLKY